MAEKIKNKIISSPIIKKIYEKSPIPRKWPISLVAGIGVISTYWTCTLVALYFYFSTGFYNPVFNWMSDLGSFALNPNGALYFNIGCILSGLGLFPFFFGLYEWYIGGKRNKNLTKATQVAGFISAFAMIMIGVYPEDLLAIHITWALTLFMVNTMTLIFPAIALYQYSFTKNVAKFAIFTACVNILLLIFITPLLEWLTIIFSFMFIAVLIQNMHKRIEKYRFVRMSKIELPSKRNKKKNKKQKKVKSE